MKILKKILIGVILASALLTPAFASAQLKSTDKLKSLQKPTFVDTGAFQEGDLGTALPQVIGRIINVVLGLTGSLLLIMIVYAGFLWISDQGNEDQVNKAKRLIRNGIIGMAIAIGAFVLTNFIVSRLISATGVVDQRNVEDTITNPTSVQFDDSNVPLFEGEPQEEPGFFKRTIGRDLF